MLPSTSVLVLEDEPLIAMTLGDEIEDLGFSCAVTSTVEEARRELSNSSPLFAVIDTLIGEETSEPIMDELARRGIPFIICSGLSSEETHLAHANAVILAKPYTREALLAAVTKVAEPCSA